MDCVFQYNVPEDQNVDKNSLSNWRHKKKYLDMNGHVHVQEGGAHARAYWIKKCKVYT